MGKYMNDDELERVRDEGRREYFHYITELREHQKKMKKRFTLTVITCVLIVSGVLLYSHYNDHTMVLVIVSPSEPITEEASKKVLINQYKKLKFDSENQIRINLEEFYNNKYGVKINPIKKDNKICNGYVLIKQTDKYYQIDTTKYCETTRA